MAKKSYHVVLNPRGGWSVRKSGSSRATKVLATQQAAVKFATQRAKKAKSELYVHRKDGRIRDRNSYGNDPYPPRG